MYSVHWANTLSLICKPQYNVCPHGLLQHGVGGYANTGGGAQVHPQHVMSLDGPPNKPPMGGRLNLADGGKVPVGSKLEGSSGEMSGGGGGRGGGKKKFSGRGMDGRAVVGAGRNGTTYNPEDEDDEDSEQEHEQSESEETEESEAVNTPLVG